MGVKKLDELIYYPSTRKTMIHEVQTALGLYRDRVLTNEQLYYLIRHYVEKFGYLFFEDDYQIHPHFQRVLGKRNIQILKTIVKEIEHEKQEENYGR